MRGWLISGGGASGGRVRAASGRGAARRSVPQGLSLRGRDLALALLCIGCVGTGPLATGGLRAQELDDVMHAALRSSLTIRADDARQEAVRNAVWGSVDAFMPSAAWIREDVLHSKITYSPDIPVVPGGLDTYAREEPDIHGFQVTLPLFDGLRRVNGYRAQRNLFDAGVQTQVGVRQQVLLDAAVASLAVVRDRRVIDLRRAYLKDLTTISRQIEARFAVRDATLTDVALAHSRMLEGQAQLDQSVSDLTTSSIAFSRISGLPPGELGPIRVPDDQVPATPQALHALLLDLNPKLRAARLQATAAQDTARATRSAVLPQLNLFMQHVQEHDVTPSQKHIKDTTVKLQLRVPLYEPGAFPRIGQSAAEATQKVFEVLDGERQADADAQSLFFQRLSIIGQIATASKRIAAVQQAVAGYKVELAAGYRTIVDTLNARAELTGARIALLNLDFERDKATFSLASALARLGAAPVAVARR